MVATILLALSVSVFLFGDTSGEIVWEKCGRSYQCLTFYDTIYFNGSSQSFTDSEENLQGNTRIGRDAKSFCVTEGLWRFAAELRGADQPITGWSSGNVGETCLSITADGHSAKYLSIHRIGAKNITRPSLSLYDEKSFESQSVFVLRKREIFNKPINVRSYAFTSDAPWTLYSGSAFNGSSICLNPLCIHKCFLLNFDPDFSVFSTHSVSQGCSSQSPSHSSDSRLPYYTDTGPSDAKVTARITFK